MLRHLLEMMPASSVSGSGRDSAINLLVKQVPRKSLKIPDNSVTLWVIDQGTRHTFTYSVIFSHSYSLMDTQNFIFKVPLGCLVWVSSVMLLKIGK